MPVSWYQAIPFIMDEVIRMNPKTVLDVGIGFGKFGVLLRETLELPWERYHKDKWLVRIEGIEAYSGYRNPIHDFVYDKVYYANIVDTIHSLPVYDVILFIDVLEHFTKDEGLQLLKDLLTHSSKALIVSTPLYPAPQGSYLGNSYEMHKSKWIQQDFKEFQYSYKVLPIENNGAQIIFIYPLK